MFATELLFKLTHQSTKKRKYKGAKISGNPAMTSFGVFFVNTRVCFWVNFKEHLKGGVFYDKLGAEVGTQNHINGALATFIDISG